MSRILSGLFVVFLLSAEGLSASEAANSAIHFSTAIISPYQMYSQDGELGGFAIPLVGCAMAQLGRTYKIDVLPWARAQKNVELGESDAFFVASRNDARDAYAQQSAPLFSGSRSWFFRTGLELDPQSNEFRENAMVGTVFGTNMHRLLMETHRNVITKTTEKELISLLEIGRLDGLFLTDLMFDHSLTSLGLEPLDFVKKESVQQPLGVYFGNHFLARNPSFLGGFNHAISECRSGGTL